MEDSEDWSIDANEALTFTLLSPRGESRAQPFHAKYTYAVFGDQESIFGYKDLEARILFAEDDMSPCVDVKWSQKLPETGEVEAEDVEKTLRDLIPEKAFGQNAADFTKRIAERPQNFVPPGERIKTYRTGSETLEVYHSTLADVRTRELLNNMQFLVTFFIEGGTALDLDDEEWTNQRWHVFFLYARSGTVYRFIGYSTLYHWYYFDLQTSDLSRVRLSQFLILTPFQQKGHGSKLYDAIAEYYVNDYSVVELTVEDPSDAFDNLRDVRDMLRLRNDEDFMKITLDAVISKKFPIEEIRRKHKMPLRQFMGCVEIELLSRVDPKDRKKNSSYRKFRLLVKQRIYKKNLDVLAQLDRLERIDKLDQTYYTVEDGYRMTLRKLDTGRTVDVANASTSTGRRRADNGDGPPAKRPKHHA